MLRRSRLRLVTRRRRTKIGSRGSTVVRSSTASPSGSDRWVIQRSEGLLRRQFPGKTPENPTNGRPRAPEPVRPSPPSKWSSRPGHGHVSSANRPRGSNATKAHHFRGRDRGPCRGSGSETRRWVRGLNGSAALPGSCAASRVRFRGVFEPGSARRQSGHLVRLLLRRPFPGQSLAPSAGLPMIDPGRSSRRASFAPLFLGVDRCPPR
jgi:hypothetical protein